MPLRSLRGRGEEVIGVCGFWVAKHFAKRFKKSLWGDGLYHALRDFDLLYDDAICKKCPGYGLTESGAREAIKRLKASGAVGRKKGSGRPTTVGTDDDVEKVENALAEYPGANARDVLRETGRAPAAARDITTNGLELK